MTRFSCTNCGAADVPDPAESQCCCPGGPSFTSNIQGSNKNKCKKPKTVHYTPTTTCNDNQQQENQKQCKANLQKLPAINFNVSHSGVCFDLDPGKKRLAEFQQRLKKPRLEQHAQCCTRCGCRRCRCPLSNSQQVASGGHAGGDSAGGCNSAQQSSNYDSSAPYPFIARNSRGHIRQRHRQPDCPWSNFCAPHDWPTHVYNSHNVNTTSLTPEQARKNLDGAANTVRQEYNNMMVPWVRQTENCKNHMCKRAFGRNHIPNPECIKLRDRRAEQACVTARNRVNATRIRLQLSGWEEAAMRQQQPSLFRRKLQQYIEASTQKGWLNKWREGGREEWKELLAMRLKANMHVNVPKYPVYVSKRITNAGEDAAAAEEIEQMLKDDEVRLKNPEKLMPGPAECQFGYSDGPPQA